MEEIGSIMVPIALKNINMNTKGKKNYDSSLRLPGTNIEIEIEMVLHELLWHNYYGNDMVLCNNCKNIYITIKTTTFCEQRLVDKFLHSISTYLDHI